MAGEDAAGEGFPEGIDGVFAGAMCGSEDVGIVVLESLESGGDAVG